MAPEQIEGQKVDHRADIFSVGAIAYELIAQAPPFDGDSLTAVMFQIMHDAPDPPALPATAYSPGLERIILKALARAGRALPVAGRDARRPEGWCGRRRRACSAAGRQAEEARRRDGGGEPSEARCSSQALRCGHLVPRRGRGRLRSEAGRGPARARPRGAVGPGPGLCRRRRPRPGASRSRAAWPPWPRRASAARRLRPTSPRRAPARPRDGACGHRAGPHRAGQPRRGAGRGRGGARGPPDHRVAREIRDGVSRVLDGRGRRSYPAAPGP